MHTLEVHNSIPYISDKLMIDHGHEYKVPREGETTGDIQIRIESQPIDNTLIDLSSIRLIPPIVTVESNEHVQLRVYEFIKFINFFFNQLSSTKIYRIAIVSHCDYLSRLCNTRLNNCEYLELEWSSVSQLTKEKLKANL
jgi:hypothetical protein